MCRLNRRIFSILLFAFFLFLLFSSPGMAGEDCSMMGGKCRDACGQNEKAEIGDFMDCGEKQECCGAKSEDRINCCIYSMDAKRYGSANCTQPKDNICPKGWSGIPVSCDKLKMCKE